MTRLLAKLRQYKKFLQEAFRENPHAFLLFGFIALIFFVSLANDAFFDNAFTKLKIPTRQPEQITTTYMTVLDVVPESGIKQSFDTFMQFTVTFSENIDSSSVQITSSPEHPIGYELTGNKLRVFPKANWEFDLGYEITINAKATNGLTLKEPYVYSMYIAMPTDSGEFEVF